MRKLEEFEKELNLDLGKYGGFFVHFNDRRICDIIAELVNTNIDVNADDVNAQIEAVENDIYDNLSDIVKNWIINYLKNKMQINYINELQEKALIFLFAKYNTSMAKLEEIRSVLEKIFANNPPTHTDRRVEELKVIYDARKSFYKKAQVELIGEWSFLHSSLKKIHLYSYNTLVCTIEYVNVFDRFYQLHIGEFSQTTLRHIKEFLKQYFFCSDVNINKKDIHKMSDTLVNIHDVIKK